MEIISKSQGKFILNGERRAMKLLFKKMAEEESRKEKQGVWREGLNPAIITKIEEKTSKSNKGFLVASFRNTETGDTIDCWMGTEQGKRWMLKSFLQVLNAFEEDEKGDYMVDTTDIVGKNIYLIIKNREEEFIGREGNPVKFIRSNVQGFKR